MSSPLSREWSSPCRCLCACKSRVRQCRWDRKENPAQVIPCLSCEQGSVWSVPTHLGSHTQGSAPSPLPLNLGQGPMEMGRTEMRASLAQVPSTSPATAHQSARPSQGCSSCMLASVSSAPSSGWEHFSKVRENAAFKMLKTSRNPVVFLPNL